MSDVEFEKTPDDLMLVTIELTFAAKPAIDAPEVDVPRSWSCCLPSEEGTADMLREIADAIDAGRLYGYMAQEIAAAPVSCGEWVEDKSQT